MGQNWLDQICDQCIAFLEASETQSKLKQRLIDPLVTYFKEQLRFFFVLITILLILILTSNSLIIYKVYQLT